QKTSAIAWASRAVASRSVNGMMLSPARPAVAGEWRSTPMSSIAFDTKRINAAPDTIAPDGSEVRLLCELSRGGMATFRLPPGAVSKAVAHRTIEEVWYFIRVRGRLWRKLGDIEEITEIAAGVSIAIPTGMHFQFRCDGAEP